MKRLFLHIFVFFLFVGISASFGAFEQRVNIDFKHDFSEILSYNLNIEGEKALQNSKNTVFDVKTDCFNTNFDVFTELTDNFTEFDIKNIENLELTAPKTVFLYENLLKYRDNYDRN
jgi:hypothetical protein